MKSRGVQIVVLAPTQRCGEMWGMARCIAMYERSAIGFDLRAPETLQPRAIVVARGNNK